jgi:hypothetical protein
LYDDNGRIRCGHKVLIWDPAGIDHDDSVAMTVAHFSHEVSGMLGQFGKQLVNENSVDSIRAGRRRPLYRWFAGKSHLS